MTIQLIQSDASEKVALLYSSVGPSVANKVRQVSPQSIPRAHRSARFIHRTFVFGPFRLLAAQQLLLEGDQPVRLGSRALDILLALVERPGELVSKRELIARVWPDLVVVEANLTVHVSALRRALRDGRTGNRHLINNPGQGYCFVAPVIVIDDPTTVSADASSVQQPNSRAQRPPMMDGADISRIDDPLRVLTASASALGLVI
jgi:DNA-binding winged helix-turn-helix (wHTH) protein